MMIYLSFDSSQRLMDNSVVSSIVLPNLSDESNQYKETATDDRNHNLNGHVISCPLALAQVQDLTAVQ
jgi:hypothetical protein